MVLFLAFFASKSYLLSLLWGYNPFLRPKLPQTPPYGLIPLSSCIALATNKKKISFVNLVSFFHFITLYGLSCDHFWPPMVPKTWPMVPLRISTQKCIIWMCNQPKNGPLFLILFIFYILWSFLAIWVSVGPFVGLFGPPPEAQSTPKVPIWTEIPQYYLGN